MAIEIPINGVLISVSPPTNPIRLCSLITMIYSTKMFKEHILCINI